MLDLSVVRVGQLAKEGRITKLKSGRYSSAAVTQYIRFLREAANKRTSFTELLEEEKHRKIKRENDLEEGLLAPVALLTEALEQAGNIMIPILESLPLVMKRNWPEITGDQIQLVKRSIAECRNAIAETEIRLDG